MTTFYHGSAAPLEVGATYQARKIRSNVSASRGLGERVRVEQLFERYRPKGKPSRLRSFFYATSPEDIELLGATSARHVYQVEPLGTIHRGDFAWLWEAGSLDQNRQFGGLFRMVNGIAVFDPYGKKPTAAQHERAVKSLVGKYWRGTKSPRGRFEWLSPSMRIVEKVKVRSRR